MNRSFDFGKKNTRFYSFSALHRYPILCTLYSALFVYFCTQFQAVHKVEKCKFHTTVASKMIETGHFYGIDGHDIKHTTTINIDVEHISTASVLFNYFLLLFNYYTSILFADFFY